MPRALFFALPATVVFTAFATGSAQQPPGLPARVDFVRDVQPILVQHCYECHGPDKQMNGFRLDRRHDAMRGGTLPVIGPGSAASSRLYLRLLGTSYGRRMPLDTDPLPAESIETIKRWIDQGAAWPDAASGETPPAPLDPAAVAAFGALRTGDSAGFLAALRGEQNLSRLRGPGGSTPLMAAALYGDAALVKTLLDRGADPRVANDAGATALMWAVTDLEKTRLLVERGADVNARSDAGRTPLIVAASIRGNRDVVALLLDRGARPAILAPGLVGPLTAVTEAAKQGDEPIVRLLLERGGELGPAGFASLGLAMRARCDGCADAIAAKLPPPLLSPAMALGAPPLGPALATVPLLARGADANVRSPTGYPMILLAAASEAFPVDAVKALIAHGADVNAASPLGETPLTVARRHGRTPVVDALLAAGATDGLPASAPPAPSPAASPRAAVLRSLPLLQRTDEQFLRMAGCVSCHNNTQTAETIALARSRRLPVDEAIAARQRTTIARYVEDWRERGLQLHGIPGDSDTMAPILEGLAAERHAADAATDAMARFIRLQQQPNGAWRVFAHRPPIESGDTKVTVDSIRALRVYAVGPERPLAEAAIARAAAWLAQAQPEPIQDRAYVLRGLHDTGADTAAIAAAARRIVALQRPDGGWSQLPTLGSDAYATGQALTVLLESGALGASDPAVRAGVRFLLRTQLKDGSWFVARRAIPIQPYFDAGFPHGRDQFISAAATNWATQALIRVSANGS